MARDSVELEKQARKEDPVKIVDLRVTPIAFADPPLRSSYGLHAPYALRTVVELVGEDGLVGRERSARRRTDRSPISRAPESGCRARRLRPRSHLARHRTPPSVVAEAPDAPGVTAVTRYLLPGEGRLDVPLRVYAALEVAALDLIGKMVGTTRLRSARRAGPRRGALLRLSLLQACRRGRRGGR